MDSVLRTLHSLFNSDLQEDIYVIIFSDEQRAPKRLIFLSDHIASEF